MTPDQIRACLQLGIYVPAWEIEAALAAATGTAKTAKQAECEASQSDPKGNAQ